MKVVKTSITGDWFRDFRVSKRVSKIQGAFSDERRAQLIYWL